MKEPVLEGPFEVVLSRDDEEKANALIEQAERDFARQESRVTIRWDRGTLEIIRRAASAYGMPYQTYLRQAALRQAIADLNDLRRAQGRV